MAIINSQLVAVIIAESSKIAGQWFRNRPIQIKLDPPDSQPSLPSRPVRLVDNQKPTQTIRVTEEVTTKARSIEAGCVPCAIGHLGTCSGLLNEAVRFSKGKDGIASEEVIDRAGMCLDELNTMERVDLRPEMILGLPEWERKLVDKVLIASRETRHTLERLDSAEALEQAAAATQTIRKEIFNDWIRARVENFTPEEQAGIQERAIDQLTKLMEVEENDD